MKTPTGKAVLVLGLAVFGLLPLRGESQAYTEFRDSLRGVTFYSVQVSTDPLRALQTDGSRFTRSDEMTLGFSAFFFDESDSVDEVVLWLRHDGTRRWFTGDIIHPLKIRTDDRALEPIAVHATRPLDPLFTGPVVEKLEFALSPPEFQGLLDADTLNIELTTLLGVVEKTLTPGEHDVMRRFHDRVREQHRQAKRALDARDSPAH